MNLAEFGENAVEGKDRKTRKRIRATYLLRYAVNKLSNVTACLEVHTKSGCKFFSCFALLAGEWTKVSNTAPSDLQRY